MRLENRQLDTERLPLTFDSQKWRMVAGMREVETTEYFVRLVRLFVHSC
jgi:hypothetical protein